MQCLPLATQGFSVRFVAPHGLHESRGGVELVAAPTWHNRWLRWFWSLSLVFRLLRDDQDLYCFQDLELLPLGLILKVFFHRKVIYDAYEDFPSMVRTKPWIPLHLRSTISKIIAGMEALAARYLDGLITADPGTMRRFAKVGKSHKLVFFNFPSLEFFPPPGAQHKAFDLVYRGGISKRGGSFDLLQALRILVDGGKQPRLLLLGYLDNREAESVICERISELGLDSLVQLRGRINYEDMSTTLSQGRIGICPLHAIRKFRLNIPVKVFEYWACGMPVVASDLPPIRPFFRDGEYGILVKPGNPEELASAVRWLLDHPQQAAQMGERGRRAVIERLNNSSEARKLVRFCRHILM